jgi:hypothetical protein
MITSRQIVELIKKEQRKESRKEIIAAYQNIINRIEVLEDVEMVNRYSSYGFGKDTAEEIDISKVFK